MTRVFVLCVERSGSHTFAAACSHITNYTSGHETRADRIVRRLDYPDAHIEIDNRLAWFLGALEHRYDDDPIYVHLTRDPRNVARSLTHRFYKSAGIMNAWSRGIIRGKSQPASEDRLAYAAAYVDTLTSNITAFLQSKTAVHIPIEDPHEPFDRLCGLICAEGDLDAAHAELDRIHHRRKGRKERKKRQRQVRR